jgi:serine/threonine-protein kinase
MDEPPGLLEGLSEEAVWRLEAACCRFEEAWLTRRRPQLEHFLAGADGPEREALLRELLRLDVYYRRGAGERPSPRDYQRICPAAAALLPDDLADPSPAGRNGSPPAPRGPANGQARGAQDTDRNLLFGVLALQADFLDNERFARACALWAADKGRPLGQVLVEQGWLTPEDRAAVERLLSRKVNKHGGDVHASLAEAVTGGGAASLAAVRDAEVQASLAAASLGAPGQTVDEPHRRAGPRYRVLRPHAVGGLGEVSVAEDTELHRQVALKEIREQHAHQESSRRRFVLEAEVTGGLEHPGVVPVYGLGVYPDGRPYYAMRLIKGETLGEAAERFHAAPTAAFDSLEFRQLLGRFIDVCQAVAYAHSRGVLHCDLKPANVMVAKYGETLVVDWGLAKVVGRPGGAAGVPEEMTLRPAAGSDGVRTLAGSAVGTPGFMSPEQAEGEVGGLGPATDVYSLGATLYVLLTNQPPLRGAVPEVLRRTQEGSWPPPRQVNAAAPAALDAVCRKAMALRPGDRYASALELAGELEHWLADEPVSAYREPAGGRLRRWARKHPRRVTAAAVLLLAGAVGLTAGTFLLERVKREARENFAIGLAGIEGSVRGVSEDFWLDEPEMQAMRHKVLRKAHDDYMELLTKHPEDRRLRQQHAAVKALLAALYLQAHREDEGIALVEQARQLYEDLLRQAPGDRQLRFGLAQAHHTLAELRLQKGEFEAGEKEVDRSIALLKPLTAEAPENQGPTCLLAWSYNLRATAKWSRGDVESGLEDNQKVLAIGEPLLSAPKLVPSATPAGLAPWRDYLGDRFVHGKGSLMLLPRAYTDRGIMLNSAGRNAEAARVLQEATAFDRWLLAQDPGLGQFRHALALALLHGGHVQVELGRPARAEPALREAREQTRKLREHAPSVPEYAATHLLAAGYLGEALFRSGRTTAAAGPLREVREQGEGVLGGAGNSRALRAQHASLLHVLGCLRRETGDVAGGLAISREAREKLERALREAPGDPSLRSALLGNGEELALGQFLKGDISRDACIAEQRRIVLARKELAGPRPTRAPRFQAELAASAALLARLLLEGGRPAEALACVDEVLPDHERFVREEQERAKQRGAANTPSNNFIWPVVSHRMTSWPPSPGGKEGPEFGLVTPAYLSGRPVEPHNLELRRQWALLLARRSAALAGVGRGTEAASAARQAIAMTEGLLRGDDQLRCPPASPLSAWSFLAEEICLQEQEPCYLYDLACHLALASTLPDNAGLADPARRAVHALRDYIAAGFDNAYRLRTDPALAPLRNRQDFRRLAPYLAAKAGGKEPA